MATVRRIGVALGERSYPVWIAAAGADFVAGRLARLERPWCVLTDTEVARHVWSRIDRSLRRRGVLAVRPIVVPSGERSKSLQRFAQLQRALLQRGAGRDTCLVVIGGGMVGDLGGFVAATFHRGIDWVAVPTTLLSMVDASVGGKTAVDVAGIKNAVGAFHQPRAVWIATEFLRTLPPRQRRSGLAEVVKYAMIRDRRLFERLESRAHSWRRPHAQHDADLVARCVRIKAQVVAADEREAGVRAQLNFGHTIGHALEGDGRRGLLHGEAVGLGMIVACSLAERLGVAREPQHRRLVALLDALGLPVRPAPLPSTASLRRAWRRDKKAVGGVPRFVLTPRIGAASVGHRIPEEDVLSALRAISEPRPAQ